MEEDNKNYFEISTENKTENYLDFTGFSIVSSI